MIEHGMTRERPRYRPPCLLVLTTPVGNVSQARRLVERFDILLFLEVSI